MVKYKHEEKHTGYNIERMITMRAKQSYETILEAILLDCPGGAKAIFGDRLKELREDAGLSQRQLAKITGVSNAAISRWESGRIPTHKYLRKLSDALGVPISELIKR